MWSTDEIKEDFETHEPIVIYVVKSMNIESEVINHRVYIKTYHRQ